MAVIIAAVLFFATLTKFQTLSKLMLCFKPSLFPAYLSGSNNRGSNSRGSNRRDSKSPKSNTRVSNHHFC